MYDIIIIGAGVSGCACARELSRYDAKILVVEKEEDVCCGTSKANSAIVHAGYDAAHGSLMAKLTSRAAAGCGPCEGAGFCLRPVRQPCRLPERRGPPRAAKAL